MGTTVEDIINASVDPAWIGVAVELVATFPKDAAPRERLSLLFSGLHQRLGTTDWIACAAVHSRVSALGYMDQVVQLSDLHPAGGNLDAGALRHAAATAPLHVQGENLVFDPASFQRCFADARQVAAAPPESKPRHSSQAAQGMTKADRARTAEELDARVQPLLLAGLNNVALLAAMADRMPTFKRLLDAAESGELDRLSLRFPAFGHYAAVLTSIATAIRDGAITVPR